MTRGFTKFIFTNLNVKIFTRVVVFNIFAVFLKQILTPLLYFMLDPNNELENITIGQGENSIKYIKLIFDMLIGVVLLFIIYTFSK
tara:strand:+ start:6 stop:263 length:258 start_codon:yes stop_codon:yes gene_type:complete